MARIGCTLRRRDLKLFQFLIDMIIVVNLVYLMWYSMSNTLNNSSLLERNKRSRRKLRMINLNRIISYGDVLCRSHLRMNRFAFSKLCELVRDIEGLSDTRNMTVEEIVAIFLYTISHHKKNRCVSSYFYSSGETVSRQFHLCLMTILKLHDVLLKKPSPITEDCEDDKWKYFKVTYIQSSLKI